MIEIPEHRNDITESKKIRANTWVLISNDLKM